MDAAGWTPPTSGRELLRAGLIGTGGGTPVLALVVVRRRRPPASGGVRASRRPAVHLPPERGRTGRPRGRAALPPSAPSAPSSSSSSARTRRRPRSSRASTRPIGRPCKRRNAEAPREAEPPVGVRRAAARCRTRSRTTVAAGDALGHPAASPHRLPSFPAPDPGAPIPAPSTPAPGATAPEDGGAEALPGRRTTLAHLHGEMPEQVRVDTPFLVRFGLSRRPIAPTPGAEHDATVAHIDATREVTVTIVPRGFRLAARCAGGRSSSGSPPTTTRWRGTSSSSRPRCPGRGEVSLIVRQGADLPLATLRLRAVITEDAGPRGGAPRSVAGDGRTARPRARGAADHSHRRVDRRRRLHPVHPRRASAATTRRARCPPPRQAALRRQPVRPHRRASASNSPTSTTRTSAARHGAPATHPDRSFPRPVAAAGERARPPLAPPRRVRRPAPADLRRDRPAVGDRAPGSAVGTRPTTAPCGSSAEAG